MAFRLMGQELKSMVPVYVAAGMIAVAATLGLHTVKQQLLHAPNVFVRKQRRETLPEVVEPDHVVEDAHEFLTKSFFRRLAHLHDPRHNYVLKDQTRADVFAHPPKKAETLKDVGVVPFLPPPYQHH